MHGIKTTLRSFWTSWAFLHMNVLFCALLAPPPPPSPPSLVYLWWKKVHCWKMVVSASPSVGQCSVVLVSIRGLGAAAVERLGIPWPWVAHELHIFPTTISWLKLWWLLSWNLHLKICNLYLHIMVYLNSAELELLN